VASYGCGYTHFVLLFMYWDMWTWGWNRHSYTSALITIITWIWGVSVVLIGMLEGFLEFVERLDPNLVCLTGWLPLCCCVQSCIDSHVSMLLLEGGIPCSFVTWFPCQDFVANCNVNVMCSCREWITVLQAHFHVVMDEYSYALLRTLSVTSSI